MLRQADRPSLSRVAELAESVGASGLTVRTEIDGVAHELPPDVAKHAGAKTVVVRLGYGPDALSVQVDDDGCGGDAPPGNGIRGMAERARALGGELTASPKENGGFRVRARLPVR